MNYQQAIFEKAFGTAAQLMPSDLPEICFCGRSNVGKSSLINGLLGRKSLARVSSKPGKTVTVNFYRVGGLRLVDLPGYGYAKVPFAERDRWSELMEAYFKSGRRICTVFILIDMRHPVGAVDFAMLDFVKQMGLPYRIILTKSDKLNKTEFSKRLSLVPQELGEFIPAEELIPFSVKDNGSVLMLRDTVEFCYRDFVDSDR